MRWWEQSRRTRATLALDDVFDAAASARGGRCTCSDVVVFEAFGVLSSGIFLMFVRVFMRGLEPFGVEPALPLATPWAGIVVLAVLAIARQLVLAAGITF